MAKKTNALKVGNQKVYLEVGQQMTISDLVDLIESCMSEEQMPVFIALLDAKVESWQCTRELIQHFEHLKKIDQEEGPGFDYKPKNLLEDYFEKN